MNKKGVRGEGGKYPCEDPETSNKRRLKEYDTLGEVNLPPPKMQKVMTDHFYKKMSKRHGGKYPFGLLMIIFLMPG